VRKRVSIGLLLAAVGALALMAAGCGAAATRAAAAARAAAAVVVAGNVSALPASSCGPMQFKGSGDADYLIASDLPKQGGSRTQTVQMAKAIAYVLDQQNWKAGKYNIAYQDCDDSTAQLGKWDPDKCSANAHSYASNSKLLGVDRHVQLGLRRDRDPGAEPGSGRRPAAALAREHLRLPDRAVRG
jgi:hypothetical protein